MNVGNVRAKKELIDIRVGQINVASHYYLIGARFFQNVDIVLVRFLDSSLADYENRALGMAHNFGGGRAKKIIL